MRGCLAIVLLPIVLMLGMILPRFFIQDGVERYGGDRNTIARAALDESDVRFGWPERYLVTADRVTDTNTCPYYIRKYGSVTVEFSADVQLYTIFGLPHGELRIKCGASSVPFIPTSRANQALHRALNL